LFLSTDGDVEGHEPCTVCGFDVEELLVEERRDHGECMRIDLRKCLAERVEYETIKCFVGCTEVAIPRASTVGVDVDFRARRSQKTTGSA